MRKIPSKELPSGTNFPALISVKERNYHARMAVALEKTLIECSKIRHESEDSLSREKIKAQADGFNAGFSLFFSEIKALIEQYENHQHARMITYTENIASAVKNSLLEPVVIEHILAKLQEASVVHDNTRIIIPRSAHLPLTKGNKTFVYSDEFNFTLQNDHDVIRFPAEEVINEWKNSADNLDKHSSTFFSSLTSDTISNIIEQLSHFTSKTE